MVYLLTAVGLTPGGSSTVRIYTQTIHRTTQFTTRTTQQNITINNKNNSFNNLIGKSAVRAPSLRIIPWHLPKTEEKARKTLM
jgi:hypothetical protein